MSLLLLLRNSPIRRFGLTTGSDDTDAASYATASVSPTANRLVLVAVANSKAATPPTTPTLSGNGLTYVQVATVAFNTIALPLRRLTVFRAMGASPSAGAITIDFGGVTQSACVWSVMEFAITDTSGTNGSGAIVQSVSNSTDLATTLTATLSGLSDVTNAEFAAWCVSAAGGVTPGSGFTELDETASATPAMTLETEWRQLGDDTSVDASWTLNPAAGIALEIKAAGAAGTNYTASPSDAENITDSATRVWTALRSQSDAENLTDALTRLWTALRSQSDSENITDTASRVFAAIRSQAEAEGITDSATRLLTALRTISDAEGLTDSQTRIWTALRSQSDAVGITDSASYVKVIAKSQSDSIGITDSATKLTTSIRTASDTEGITDTRTQAATFARSQSDAEGITDSATYQKVLAKSQSDAIGITDSVSSTATDIRSPSDAVGLTDAISKVSAYVRSRADAIGLTDSVTYVKLLVTSTTDAVGITDSVSFTSQDAHSQADAVGITDAVSEISASSRLRSDPVGITDTATYTKIVATSKSDPIGLTDSTTKLSVTIRTTSDPVGISDSVALSGTAVAPVGVPAVGPPQVVYNVQQQPQAKPREVPRRLIGEIEEIFALTDDLIWELEPDPAALRAEEELILSML